MKNTKELLDYKSNNKLLIILGNKLNNNIFNKNIKKSYFNEKQNLFLDKYKMISYNNIIYKINNSIYCDKKHYMHTNFKILNESNNNMLYVLFNQIEKKIHEFTCSNDYFILHENITEFIINNDISIKFIDNNDKYNIKIDVDINNNIDNNIEKINELISLLDYSQYLHLF